MSTTSLDKLFDYLLETLSVDELKRLSGGILSYVKQQEQELPPYTIEELNARINLSERQSAAGEVLSEEEVFAQFANDFPKELEVCESDNVDYGLAV